ncbi:MAG TPA: gas vesicle protein [Gemmatimonadaceae bacterium]|nr:gas vesicle protein [Gemmatimonadaceae bacterium]
MTPRDELDADERLVLSDMLNHVLDKGVVISGDVIISVADVDLVQLRLSVLISSVETAARQIARAHARTREDEPPDAGLPVLPRRRV